MPLRKFIRESRLSSLGKKLPEWKPRNPSAPVLLFSPHYDDETLGAGATIIQMREHGVPVHLVFMTDGSTSHAQWMDRATLSRLRREESIRAAAVLGVDANHVHLLEIPEKRVHEHRAEAVARAAELITRLEPGTLFVPAVAEPLVWSSDHCTTASIVFEALDSTGARPEIVEYLVWFWYHWPWVPVFTDADRSQLLRLSWQYRFGARAFDVVNCAVPISDDVRSRKWNALSEYKTQMTRFASDKPWPILADVAQGEFLQCFFGAREYFRAYPYGA